MQKLMIFVGASLIVAGISLTLSIWLTMSAAKVLTFCH